MATKRVTKQVDKNVIDTIDPDVHCTVSVEITIEDLLKLLAPKYPILDVIVQEARKGAVLGVDNCDTEYGTLLLDISVED